MLWKRWAVPVLWAVFWLPCQLRALEEAEQPEVLEARILYEAAAGMMDRGEYDRALRRFDWISADYKGSAHAALAFQRRKEIRRMSVEIAISPPARVGLTVFGTVYAAWVGIGAGILAESEELTYLGMIAGPVAGMTTSLDRTREAALGNGQASLLVLGGAWGTWQGVGAAVLAGSGYKTVVGASMGGGALGFAAASSIVRRTWVTAGEATLVNFGGIWGAWFALCGAKSLGVTDSDALLGSAMAGGNLGLLQMGALAPRPRDERRSGAAHQSRWDRRLPVRPGNRGPGRPPQPGAPHLWHDAGRGGPGARCRDLVHPEPRGDAGVFRLEGPGPVPRARDRNSRARACPCRVCFLPRGPSETGRGPRLSKCRWSWRA